MVSRKHRTLIYAKARGVVVHGTKMRSSVQGTRYVYNNGGEEPGNDTDST